MKKYKRKPIIVEAIQLTEHNIREVYEELNGKVELNGEGAEEEWYDYQDIIKRDGIDVHTPPEGLSKLRIGNYLVKRYSGKFDYHYWPVDADYFEQNYEEI